MRYAFVIVFIALQSIVGLSQAAHAGWIDDFTVGAISVVRGTSVAIESQSGLDVDHVAGGARHFEVGRNGLSGQTATVDTQSGKFQFISGGTSNGYLKVTYGSTSTPLNLDLTANGGTHFEVVFENVGVSPINVDDPPTFLLTSSINSTELTLGFSQTLPLGGGRYRSRAAFSDNSAINFEDIDSIAFSLGRYPIPGVLTVYSIQSISIPEPAAWLLLPAGAGLLSAAARRR